MREGSILLTSPEVHAILNGSKTQYRRIVEREFLPSPGRDWAECLCREIDRRDTPCEICTARFGESPYGPGDLLHGKEAWTQAEEVNHQLHIFYRADYSMSADTHWRSPVTMPLWASRITLDVLSVRAEDANPWTWVITFRCR